MNLSFEEGDLGSSQGSLSVTQYFTRLKSLWEEFSSLKPLIACSCRRAQLLQDFLQMEYVMNFLMELNDSYS